VDEYSEKTIEVLKTQTNEQIVNIINSHHIALAVRVLKERG